ncbi:Bol1p Ecym_5023 [Eremothecium cymbalariae DBVPG|uniref:BolA protein n=1 Tax=Eremothecium cymbalariae (strain CBS 270.75 / DBVPG 7215 / KCTC 17166 / NRRL Y-17582) TaxID=931890 RepID=I6NCN2_ERECY|nr:hypothetical protein Ecym_5023 [Eremothecium cymbalariae DBVPG\
MFKHFAKRTFSKSIISMTTKGTSGAVADRIEWKVRQRFLDLTHFILYNDSHKHRGHMGIADAENKAESHFRLEVVSDQFQGMSLPQRHRLMYSLLDEELTTYGVHALQLTTSTVDEHAKKAAD